jgi:tetratricopeptide (TPR) repeat protein
MGIVYRRTGRFDAAHASYEQALSIHPDYHYARRNLGVLCDLYLADLECALNQYESYVEIVSDDEQVVIWIADIRIRLGVSE